ncbi:MAG: hypothetical protein ACFFF4_04430 [Candidatus Thorarchaeota archaeon]
MGQGERIERIKPCPLTPSSKRSLETQGFRKSLNLHVKPNPILVAVSLTLILMVGGPAFFYMLLIDILYPWEDDHRLGYYGDYDFFFWFASLMWSGITLLAGLMIIKKRLNLHSRSYPILDAVSLTLFFLVSNLVFVLWLAFNIGYFGVYFWVSLIILPGVTLLAGVIVFVPDVTGWIKRGQTEVREFNKTKYGRITE